MLVQTTEEMCESLRQKGHRVTDQRRLILDVIATRSGHFTANDILDEVQRRTPSLGRATVFRSLDLLAQIGLLSRVHETEGCHAYVLCDDSHHHHLICSQCGLVVNVPNCDLTEQTRELTQTSNFRIDGHRLEYFGLCQPCQVRRA